MVNLISTSHPLPITNFHASKWTASTVPYAFDFIETNKLAYPYGMKMVAI